jgi:DNA-binding MarR family transcriptional regulator
MDPGQPKIIHLQRVRSLAQVRLEAAAALAHAADKIVKLAEKTLGEHNVTLPQFDVLSNLAMHDGLTQQELAARLQVTKGNVCGLLDRLEKAGWVKRKPDENDGRVNRLSITPLGRQRIDSLRPLHDVAVANLLQNWTADDADALVRILARIDQSEQS